MKTSLILLFVAMSTVNCDNGESTNNMLPSVSFYIEKNGHRMVEVFENNEYKSGNEMIECRAYGDKYIAEKVLQLVLNIPIKEVDKQRMNELANKCNERMFQNLKNEITRSAKIPVDAARDELRLQAIFPGTKWCGAGNVSESEDDLGPLRETDMCCRAHDHCNDSIPVLESKHGIKNTYLYTISNCACDEEFYSCLQNASKKEEIVPDVIGVGYFNLLGTKCFKYDYPQTGCLEKAGIEDSCQEYELDYSGTKKYQFFDPKFYNASNSLIGDVWSYLMS